MMCKSMIWLPLSPLRFRVLCPIGCLGTSSPRILFCYHAVLGFRVWPYSLCCFYQPLEVRLVSVLLFSLQCSWCSPRLQPQDGSPYLLNAQLYLRHPLYGSQPVCVVPPLLLLAVVFCSSPLLSPVALFCSLSCYWPPTALHDDPDFLCVSRTPLGFHRGFGTQVRGWVLARSPFSVSFSRCCVSRVSDLPPFRSSGLVVSVPRYCYLNPGIHACLFLDPVVGFGASIWSLTCAVAESRLSASLCSPQAILSAWIPCCRWMWVSWLVSLSFSMCYRRLGLLAFFSI